jgi:hypothetical protein
LATAGPFRTYPDLFLNQKWYTGNPASTTAKVIEVHVGSVTSAFTTR